MKINSIGIDAYRQAMEKPQTENRLVAEKDSKAAETSKVLIPSQAEKVGSKLGVKLKPGAFIDMLSQEEKEAFAMVFEKFRQLSTPDGSYASDGVNNKNTTGNFVDVTL